VNLPPDALYLELKRGMLRYRWEDAVRSNGTLKLNELLGSETVCLATKIVGISPARFEDSIVMLDPLGFLDWAKGAGIWNEAELLPLWPLVVRDVA
jgi:hypothetical protein